MSAIRNSSLSFMKNCAPAAFSCGTKWSNSAGFFSKNKSNAAISNICKPAVERWKHRYTSAIDAYVLAKEMFERTKKTGDIVLITNAENTFKDCEKEKVSWISSRRISVALSAFTSLCRKSSITTTKTWKS